MEIIIRPTPEAFEGPINSRNPASVLQLHANVTVCLDEEKVQLQ